MPYKSNNGQQASENKGGPTVAEQEKGAGNLPVNERDEQTEQHLADEAQDAGQRHPNRHTGKQDIGKAPYA